MASRFEEIDKNIFSPSQQIRPIYGDNYFPFNLNIGSIVKTFPINESNNNKLHESQSNPAPVEMPSSLPEEVIEQKSEEQKEEIQENIPQRKQYSIETDNSSLIKLPSDYSTDIYYEKQVVDYINGKNKENWEKKCETDKITVYQIFVSKI